MSPTEPRKTGSGLVLNLISRNPWFLKQTPIKEPPYHISFIKKSNNIYIYIYSRTIIKGSYSMANLHIPVKETPRCHLFLQLVQTCIQLGFLSLENAGSKYTCYYNSLYESNRLVYLPTFTSTIKINHSCRSVGKYTVHGWYG